MVGAGESFAEAPLGDKRSFPATVQAERPSEVILVPVDGFRDQMMRNPELGLRMLTSMASQLRHLVTLVDDLTLKNVEARFSLYLVRLCGKTTPDVGQQVEIPVTWQVLASHLGCTSESLSRLLKFLKNRGSIDVQGHKVTILEPEDLLQFG
jgi:CRP/FNR family transcriptional regulator